MPLGDAEYISSLDVPGATTPSEKLRAIIAEARERSEGSRDYEGSLKNYLSMTAPAVMQLKRIENEEKMHSELVFKVIQWAQETLAYISTSIPKDNAPIKKELKDLENTVADRVFGFVEAVMRMGITKNNNCYTPTVVSSRVEPVLEISDVISSIQSK
ncbi:hypothetical protein BVY02_01745 [bacterium J17]|nr:hypothetical protein BVY02_01745 [bacterium J17]